MEADPYGSSRLLRLTPFLVAPLSTTSMLGGSLGVVMLLVAYALLSSARYALSTFELADLREIDETPSRALDLVFSTVRKGPLFLRTLFLLETFAATGAVALATTLAMALPEAAGLNQTWVLIGVIVLLSSVFLGISALRSRVRFTTTRQRLLHRLAPVLLLIHYVLHLIYQLLDLFRPTPKESVEGVEGDDVIDPLGEPDLVEDTGILEDEEQELLDSILAFGNTKVREIMVSRMDIVAVSDTFSLGEALETFESSGHSRLPVYQEHLDDMLGILYVKDLIPLLRTSQRSEKPAWRKLCRAPLFVSPEEVITDLLKAFRSRRTHLAVVVDEYGGTEGLVTMEDILEEIVGDIRDEYDVHEQALYEQLDEHTYRFDARIDLDELNDVIEAATEEVLPNLNTDEYDFETLGGLIQHLTESVPTAGSELRYGPLHLKVEDVENHRIGHVYVRVEAKNDQEAS